MTVDHPAPETGKPPHTLWITGALLSVVILIADQLSKWWVLYVLRLPELGSVPVLPFFDLTMVWNRGVSFGLLTADNEFGRWALVVLSGAIAVVFAVWLARATRRLTVVALGLVIGGAIGNKIDRIQYGAVADFFNFGPIFPWVFNVADSAITIGALLLAYDLLKNPDPPARKPARRSSDGAGGGDSPSGVTLRDDASTKQANGRADQDGGSDSSASDGGGDGGGGGGGD